jgi:imidazolonepropionase-like amidohydrolase
VSNILFTNVAIFDGSGSASFKGQVLVEGNRIKAVSKDALAADGAEVIDGGGATLMPGLVEAHGHLSFIDKGWLRELGDVPIEEHMVHSVYNAKLLLDSGFTSVYSAASAKPRIDVVLRNEINAGRMPGPRLRAATPEITATAGLSDERQMHMDHSGVELIADGPEELRRAVRTMVREGVEIIKLNISGEPYVRPGFGERCAYSEAEVAMVAEEAHRHGVWLSCHARADAAVRLALKYNFRAIYHCDFVSEKTLDLIEEKKNEIFLAPAIGIVHATAYEGAAAGITREIAEYMGAFHQLESGGKVFTALRKRGVRILPGGDYGFSWNPQGNNARDLEHFVNYYGFKPAEALRAATELGGQIMGMELGLVKPGYLADLLLVDGDPVANLKLLQDRSKLLAIMKDGQFHKVPKTKHQR